MIHARACWDIVACEQGLGIAWVRQYLQWGNAFKILLTLLAGKLEGQQQRAAPPASYSQPAERRITNKYQRQRRKRPQSFLPDGAPRVDTRRSHTHSVWRATQPSATQYGGSSPLKSAGLGLEATDYLYPPVVCQLVADHSTGLRVSPALNW